MREIKFRGKRTQAKDIWVYGYYSVHTGHHYISDESGMEWLVDPKTVGEFTGLLDKNGKEIYEGDKRANGDWVGYSSAWGMFGFTDGGYIERIDSSDEKNIIIGNIYETKTGNL